MKKILLVVALVVIGLVAYNHFATPGSAEERELSRLEKEFDQARSGFKQAGRTAALSGLDTTSDAEAARRSVKSTEQDLKQLRQQLESPTVIAKADRLAQEIQGFYGDLR